jgi:hypothetical protein
MKQMMTTSAGVFLAISIISLILGGFAFSGKSNLENEIKHRDIISGTINEKLGLDKAQLLKFQIEIDLALKAAGISGALAVGLAVAGKDKDKDKEKK